MKLKDLLRGTTEQTFSSVIKPLINGVWREVSRSIEEQILKEELSETWNISNFTKIFLTGRVDQKSREYKF